MTLDRLSLKLPLAFINALANNFDQSSGVALDSLRPEVKCEVSLTPSNLIM
jgi:hypothetical protein